MAALLDAKDQEPSGFHDICRRQSVTFTTRSTQKMRLPTWLPAAVPLIAQMQQYRAEWIARDITAGLAVAAVALPIGVAYPAIAGLPPVIGLYASILPLIAYAIFGSSRQLIVGPDAATLTILAASLSQVPMMESEQ